MKQIKTLFLLTSIMLAGQSAVAENFQLSKPNESEWRGVVALGAGAAFLNLNSPSKTLYTNPEPIFPVTFNPTNTRMNAGLFDIFLGAERSLGNQFIWQTGLDFNYNSETEKGKVVALLDNDPFSYSISNQQLFFENKVYYVTDARLLPYVLAGIGVSLNKAYGFKQSLGNDLSFANKTKTAFAYKIGTGLDFQVVKNLRLGVGYRFANLGSSELGKNQFAEGTGKLTGGTLGVKTISVQEVLGQISYIF